MDSYTTLSNIQLIINSIFESTQTAINIVEVTKLLPNYLNQQIMKTIQIGLDTITIRQPQKLSNSLREEHVDSISKIDKDTLMPKDLSRQKDETKKCESPPALSLRNTKVLSHIKMRSSLRNSSVNKSMSFTDKNSKRSEKSSLKQQSKFIVIDHENNEEQEDFKRLRQQKQMLEKEDEQQKKIKQEKDKHFNEALQIMNKLIQSNPKGFVSFDFEGEPTKAIISNQKIKNYSLRASFGNVEKKVRQNYVFSNARDAKKIEINRYNKEKDNQKPIKAMDTPVFPLSCRQTIDPTQVANYKLQEYRKHFGGRYARLDKTSKTIDYTSNKQINEFDQFSKEKHLRDSIVNESKITSISKGHTRKLALPKLNGKYTVLDRYE